jgi:hypothetical protein
LQVGLLWGSGKASALLNDSRISRAVLHPPLKRDIWSEASLKKAAADNMVANEK